MKKENESFKSTMLEMKAASAGETKFLKESLDKATAEVDLYKKQNEELKESLTEMKVSLDIATEALNKEKLIVEELRKKITLFQLRQADRTGKESKQNIEEKQDLIREILRAKEDLWIEREKAQEKIKEEIEEKETAIAQYEENWSSITKMASQSLQLLGKRFMSFVKQK